MVYVSDNNQDYTEAGSGKPGEMQAVDLPRMLQCDLNTQNAKPKARYVKIVLKNYGIIPSGLPGAGHKAWLFADEIEIN